MREQLPEALLEKRHQEKALSDGGGFMVRKKVFFLVSYALFFLHYPILGDGEAWGEEHGEITIRSAAFAEGEMIPQQYTCDGTNVSPPLSWDNTPETTKSLALISDDPDAPAGTWVHWVIYNLPPDIRELPENIPGQRTLATGAQQGTNDFRKIGYGGPCPPSGTHRYYFKIYALDTVLDSDPGMTKAELLQAMEDHILARGQLLGTYKR